MNLSLEENAQGFQIKKFTNELRNIEYCLNFLIDLSNNNKNNSEITRIQSNQGFFRNSQSKNTDDSGEFVSLRRDVGESGDTEDNLSDVLVDLDKELLEN